MSSCSSCSSASGCSSKGNPGGAGCMESAMARQDQIIADRLAHIRHKIFVMSGKGGDIVLAEAKRVLREEYPELDGKILPTLPDEKFRRVGQSMAAASLPEIG